MDPFWSPEFLVQGRSGADTRTIRANAPRILFRRKTPFSSWSFSIIGLRSPSNEIPFHLGSPEILVRKLTYYSIKSNLIVEPPSSMDLILFATESTPVALNFLVPFSTFTGVV
jgi:hypothetical protein